MGNPGPSKEDDLLRTAGTLLVCMMAVFSMRCPQGERTHEIRTSDDDGCVIVLADSLPRAVGWVCSDAEEAKVGTYVDSTGDTLISRAFYQFDIGLREDPLRLHLQCLGATGDRGPSRVYAVPDFEAQLRLSVNPAYDVSDHWNAADSGVLVATLSSIADTSFTVDISSLEVPESWSRLSFVLALADEGGPCNRWYDMMTWDYATNHNTTKPYVVCWWHGI